MSHVRGALGVEPASAGSRDPALRGVFKEVLAITLGVPLCLFVADAGDPFLLETEFPWLVFLPLLVGAQHGAAAGGVSSALLWGAAWGSGLYGERTGVPAALAAWGAGALSAGVLSGYFRDRAEARWAALSAQAEDDRTRLARLSRAHAALSLSHQMLEERLNAQSWSLAAALSDARRMLATQQSAAGRARAVLEVLSTHAMVQSASLLLRAPSLGRRGSPESEFELVAQIGAPRPPDVGDPLVVQALTRGRLVAVDACADASDDASVLAAAPLVSSDGRQLGVLLLHELPFIAFHAAHLRNVATLVAHLSDLWAEAGAAGEAPAHGVHGGASKRLPFESAAVDPRIEDGALELDDFDGTRTGTRVRPGAVRSAGA